MLAYTSRRPIFSVSPNKSPCRACATIRCRICSGVSSGWQPATITTHAATCGAEADVLPQSTQASETDLPRDDTLLLVITMSVVKPSQPAPHNAAMIPISAAIPTIRLVRMPCSHLVVTPSRLPRRLFPDNTPPTLRGGSYTTGLPRMQAQAHINICVWCNATASACRSNKLRRRYSLRVVRHPACGCMINQWQPAGQSPNT